MAHVKVISLLLALLHVGLAIQRGNEHITPLSSIPRSFVSSQSLYQRFATMYGPSLQRSFASPLTLEQAVSTSQTIESKYVRKTACVSYAVGTGLSKKIRMDAALAERSAFFVYLQSRKSDLICFFWRGALPINLQVKYAYPIPSGIKIHDILYKTIDRMAHQSAFARTMTEPHPHQGRDFHLTITTFYGDKEGVHGAVALANSLNKYDTSVYKSFFWTAAHQSFFKPLQQRELAAASHYVDVLSLELDRQRSKTWASLSSVLKTYSMGGSKNGSSQSLSVDDPCSFTDMRRKQYTGKLTLSVTHLLSHANTQMGAACLSFMVAHFLGTSESSVFHVALTSNEVLLNNNARAIIEGASASDGQNLDFQPYTANALTGDGQVISMADTGVDVDSCYFHDDSGRVDPSDISSPVTDSSKRKVIQYTVILGQTDTTDAPGGHGTHVAGTLVGFIPGANIGFDALGQYSGVANGAKLAVMDLAAGSSEGLFIPGSADATYLPGYSAGSRVHCNSWGSFFQSGDQGHYASSDLDGWLQQHPDVTIFFAAGNAGDVAYAVSMQAQAKNVVAVASSETTLQSMAIDNVAWYSSFGPAYDGRIKPDVIAPGDSLMSANARGDGSFSCDTIIKTGTSQATPACAGSAALVRQYFADSNFFSSVCDAGSASSSGGCGAFSPSGVLIKAMMLHSGTQMANYHSSDGNSDQQLSAPPDNAQGYGRVTLPNILPLPNQGSNFVLYVDDQPTLGSNTKKAYTISVSDSSYPLKATVSWYDAPNQDGISTQALLNDLDLLLVSPSQQQYYGNGANTGNSGFDSINNNEQVYVNSPDTGDWTLTISSNALFSGDTQPYSLVVTMLGSINDGSGSSGETGAENDGQSGDANDGQSGDANDGQSGDANDVFSGGSPSCAQLEQKRAPSSKNRRNVPRPSYKDCQCQCPQSGHNASSASVGAPSRAATRTAPKAQAASLSERDRVLGQSSPAQSSSLSVSARTPTAQPSYSSPSSELKAAKAAKKEAKREAKKEARGKAKGAATGAVKEESQAKRKRQRELVHNNTNNQSRFDPKKSLRSME